LSGSGPFHILAVADSDSYVKWAAGVLDALPWSWTADLVIVRTPIAPSRSQVTAAIAGTRIAARAPQTLKAREIRRFTLSTRPDIVVMAATGPVVDVLMSRTLAKPQPRPAYVSGLPGISVPATERAALFRSAVDLFITHSHREAGEFKQLASSMGVALDIGLATLPSLAHIHPPADVTRDRVIFAPQALVPKTRNEREHILLALADLARRHPELTPVVKVRAAGGESQTHRERLSYDELWRGLVQQGRVPPGSITFEQGSMVEHLQRAAGFVTVSSTAALEAIASDVPTIVLSDFGVNEEMINVVFEGSELLGTLDDLADARFFHPDPSWLRDNYFQPSSDNDLLPRLTQLAEAARDGGLPNRSALMDRPEHARMRRRAARRLYVHPQLLRARSLAGRLASRLR
jgi:hypothetical protein